MVKPPIPFHCVLHAKKKKKRGGGGRGGPGLFLGYPYVQRMTMIVGVPCPLSNLSATDLLCCFCQRLMIESVGVRTALSEGGNLANT